MYLAKGHWRFTACACGQPRPHGLISCSLIPASPARSAAHDWAIRRCRVRPLTRDQFQTIPVGGAAGQRIRAGVPPSTQSLPVRTAASERGSSALSSAEGDRPSQGAPARPRCPTVATDTPQGDSSAARLILRVDEAIVSGAAVVVPPVGILKCTRIFTDERV